MQVRVLGSAAGGGFPQWNCNCANCRGVRSGTLPARPRLQCSIALSGDGRRWFLLGASPDVRVQIESFPPLLPSGGVRGTGLAGVLLTGADLDQVLGLLVLREGLTVVVHATTAVRRSLAEGLRLDEVLGCYCPLEWREPPHEPAPLRDASGNPSGLLYQAFAVPGKPPRYREGLAAPSPGDTIGYRFVDERTGGRLVFLPSLAAWDDGVQDQVRACDAVLFDGTFWDEDEMVRTGAGSLRAGQMGHLPIGGPAGSLTRLTSLPIGRKVYVHINNTNPILREDSAERRAVEAAGMAVGWDGMEFTV
jgi:pyrroloquinoline quinone biosynthesis protein B